MVTYVKEDSNFNQGVRNLNQKRQDAHNSAMPEKKKPLILTSVILKDAGVKVRIPFIKEIKDHLNKLQAARQWWVLSDCDTSEDGFKQHPYGQSYVYGNKVFDASKKKREKNLKYSLGIRPTLTFNKIDGLNSGDEFRLGTYTFLMVSDTVAVCESLVGYSPYEDNIKSKDIPSKFDECSMKEKIDEWWDVVANKTKKVNDNSMSAEQDIKGDNGEQNEQGDEQRSNENEQSSQLDDNNLPESIARVPDKAMNGLPDEKYSTIKSFSGATISIPNWDEISDIVGDIITETPYWINVGDKNLNISNAGVVMDKRVWMKCKSSNDAERKLKAKGINPIPNLGDIQDKSFGVRPTIKYDFNDQWFADNIGKTVYVVAQSDDKNIYSYPFRVLDKNTLISENVLFATTFGEIQKRLGHWVDIVGEHLYKEPTNENQEEEKTESVSRDFWNMLIESKQYK